MLNPDLSDVAIGSYIRTGCGCRGVYLGSEPQVQGLGQGISYLRLYDCEIGYTCQRVVYRHDAVKEGRIEAVISDLTMDSDAKHVTDRVDLANTVVEMSGVLSRITDMTKKVDS